MPVRRALLALALALLGGCASPDTTPSTERRPAAPPPADGDTARTPDRPATPREEPTVTDLWQDATAGPLSTLVYVTEQVGPDGKAGPAALVFSSDPANAHFKRGDSPRVTVHRLTRAELGGLLKDLDGSGLRRLPWSDEAVDAVIGPARALYLYERGGRRRVEKAALDDEGRRVFTSVERRLIQEAGKEHEGPLTGSAAPEPSRLPRSER